MYSEKNMKFNLFFKKIISFFEQIVHILLWTMHQTMYLVGYVIEKRIVFTSSKTSAILIRVSSGKSLKVGTSFKKAEGERKKNCKQTNKKCKQK